MRSHVVTTLFLTCWVGCATAPPPPAAKPEPPPAPVAAAPQPVAVMAAPAPEPEPEAAEPDVAAAPQDASPPGKARPCNARKIQVSVTRATGEGSYILRLSCSGTTFAVSSDRARPDGTELMNVFKVAPVEWERAYHAVEVLRWRTYDDACGPGESGIGRGARGPVYRVEIQDSGDRRSFHCAGTKAFADELDRIHAHLLSYAPSAAMPAAGVSDRIGVESCDTFLDNYQRCIEHKVPVAERSEMQGALGDTRVRLRDALVADPSSGPALTRTCHDLVKEAAASTKKYGCTF